MLYYKNRKWARWWLMHGDPTSKEELLVFLDNQRTPFILKEVRPGLLLVIKEYPSTGMERDIGFYFYTEGTTDVFI